ncbi:MAG: hypothetical protein WCL50_03995 [Spirochaetota bacterium]
MQVDLDDFVAFHNEERPCQGRNMDVSWPLEIFEAGIKSAPEASRPQAG